MKRQRNKPTPWRNVVTETRRRLNMSRCDFARMLGGCDRSTIWSWEAGEREPNPATKVLLVLLSPEYTDDQVVSLIQAASADAYKLDALFSQQAPAKG